MDKFVVNKNTVITVDDSLIKYAERRAKEILGENMAYSPYKEYSSSNAKNIVLESNKDTTKNK